MKKIVMILLFTILALSFIFSSDDKTATNEELCSSVWAGEEDWIAIKLNNGNPAYIMPYTLGMGALCSFNSSSWGEGYFSVGVVRNLKKIDNSWEWSNKTKHMVYRTKEIGFIIEGYKKEGRDNKSFLINMHI